MYELPSDLCKKWFNGERFGRIGTIGDGSCFFHSVCLGLNVASYRSGDKDLKQKVSLALRKALSDSFKEEDYNKIFKTLVGHGHKTFAQIKDDLKNPKTWAEEIMIKWASKFMGANIIFLNLSNNSNTPYCGVHDIMTLSEIKRCVRPGLPTIVVGWINSSHFELVARIDSVDSKHVVMRTAFDPKNAADLVTIQNLMRAYKVHCKA